MAAVKQLYRSASVVSADRVVFNIKGYVHLVRFGRSEFATATSERCLLTMLLPARELRTSLVPNLHASLRSLFERLDVPQEFVSRELALAWPPFLTIPYLVRN